MSAIPKVSVIIPTYNRRDYVQEAIDSVLAQTYTDYEVIVVDDGSTDHTGEVLQARYGEGIRYKWQKNQGESQARNEGLSLSQGEYVAFLDSDDLWLPHKLARQLSELTLHPDVDMVFSQAWMIDEQGCRVQNMAPLGSSLSPADYRYDALCVQNGIVGPSTVIIRRRLLDEVGGFNTAIRFGEDWDLWIRVAAASCIHFIPEVLACIRRHQGSQCYFPDPEKNLKRLSDHLAILNNAYTLRPTVVTEEQMSRAKAMQYVYAFLSEIAVGSVDSAERCLHEAHAIWSDILEEDTFGQYVADHAVSIAEITKAVPDRLRNIEDFLGLVLSQLQTTPPARRLSTRRVLGKAYAALGFYYMTNACHATARKCFLRALGTDLAWAQNRGLLSSLFRASLSACVNGREQNHDG